MSDVLTKKNLTEFFSEQVKLTVRQQKVRISEEVEFYLVQLLSHYAVSTNLFDVGAGGDVEYRPLALRLYDAVFEEHPGMRFTHLKKLGDTALYHAGVFYEGLYNQVVDVGYYINMGGNAYHSLADLSTHSDRTLAPLFRELAERFPQLVEVLYLCCESGSAKSDNDILKLIDRYVKTGSQKAREILEEKGISTDILLRSPGVQ